ncbi:peptidase inhibitor family I36 protein [Nonomuraea guangzhouensis]|uniref:Peptidase inhibitor family I36 protein n=1 Tax=Nonomuraea guangzhouensis TaxID=1291555 RepID=A0ABW4GN20_9ACTN|nr:peptidase inhibitor family I36 protein [Nonomuraea guangzhouensis]
MSLTAAIATAAASLALPASAAHADDPLPCPRIYGVCAWTEPSGKGELKLLFGDDPYLEPPVRAVQNQTGGLWCFYAYPYFQGERWQIAGGETVRDLGLDSRSARRGTCG